MNFLIAVYNCGKTEGVFAVSQACDTMAASPSTGQEDFSKCLLTWHSNCHPSPWINNSCSPNRRGWDE